MLAFFVVTDTEGYEMYLEISSMQELNIINRLNPHLGKHKFPILVLIKIDDLFITGKKKEEDSIILVMKPIHRDPIDLFRMLDISIDDLEESYEDYFLVVKKNKKRIWYLTEIRLNTGKSYFVLYSRKKKEIQKEG